MPFCTNCGKQFPDNAKFCPECGARIGTTTPENQEQRRQIYVGEVRKCPSCGMELPGMVAICPACGYEINSQNIHPTIAKFAEALTGCDREIADEKRSGMTQSAEKASGWSSWGPWGKFGWVMLNIYTACIPLVFYRIKRNRPHTPATIKKASIIENCQVPNEKAALIEMLYLIRAKIDGLSAQGSNEETLYWINLWSTKAKALYDKARILIPNDKTVSGVYSDISAQVKKIKSTVILKRTAIIFPLALFISLIAIGEISTSHTSLTSKSQTNHYTSITKFVEGYEKAEFSKFNSPASENGLDGTKIYIACAINRISLTDLSDQISIEGYAVDSEGNNWLVMMNSTFFVPEDTYDHVINKPIILCGVYKGYSNKYEMPAIFLSKLYVIGAGEIMEGIESYSF